MILADPQRRLQLAWLDLSLREKLLIAAAASLAVVFLFLTLVWRPLQAWRRASLTELRTADMVLARLTQAPGGTGSAQARAEASGAALGVNDLAASAAEFGLAIGKLEPEGAGARVSLENVEFAKLIAWLDRLGQQRPGRLLAVRIERQGAPGAVNAELLIAGL